MDQSQSAKSVVTYSGCDLKEVHALQWQDDHTIDGEFKAMTDGKLTITVSAASAVANTTDVQLDGNQTGTQPDGDGDLQASVRPNGDDFQWKVPCQAGFAFSGLTVKVNVNGNQAAKTYVLNGHTCSLQLEGDPSKIVGASWMTTTPTPLAVTGNRITAAR